MNGDAMPRPKSAQLARGQRRYRRHVASPKQWQALQAAANLVPLCPSCHDLVTRRNSIECRLLLDNLTDAEYAYMIERGGEQYPERAYGLRYAR